MARTARMGLLLCRRRGAMKLVLHRGVQAALKIPSTTEAWQGLARCAGLDGQTHDKDVNVPGARE